MPITYVVFDLLYLRGDSLLAAPLNHRRDIMQRLVPQAASPGIVVSDALLENGCKLFAEVARLRLEGIVAKRLDSPYLPGKRSQHWLKIKPARVSVSPGPPRTVKML